jgi:hypothetical protein
VHHLIQRTMQPSHRLTIAASGAPGSTPRRGRSQHMAETNAVSRHTGVPVNMLSGDTIDAVWDSARAAVEWKQATAPPPPPPTAVVPVPMLDRTVQMRGEAPDDWMAAWRAGQLAGRGAPAPPPRRTGEQYRNAAP